MDERLLDTQTRAYITSLLSPVWLRQFEGIREHYRMILEPVDICKYAHQLQAKAGGLTVISDSNAHRTGRRR